MKFSIQEILNSYRAGDTNPREHIGTIRTRISNSDNTGVWIHLLDDTELEPYFTNLESVDPSALPLFGIPFAIKDNLDLAGVPTTAACPEYCYIPEQSACVVQKLIDAGAIPVGKTNLDQFATGLVGTRSPYPIPVNPGWPDRIPGGSSSGSAVAVAENLVPFSLGTDTAGSGRVPAAFNGLWGLKPSKGRLSTTGVVPACRSLDCVSIFANSADDCETVLGIVQGFDPADPFSQESADTRSGGNGTIGIPRQEDLMFFGDAAYAQAWETSIETLKACGWKIEEIDFSPFLEAARLLYEGPWVSERYAAIEAFLDKFPEALHPVTRTIILGGASNSAVQAFKSQYRLAEIRRKTETAWASLDAIVTPTAGGFPTLAEVNEDPIEVNSKLGYYTNFMNLLDLSAVASPSGLTKAGLPFGLTWIAPRDRDRELLRIASKGPGRPAKPTRSITLVLFGAHMQGLALNESILALGATFNQEVRTAPLYKMVHLAEPAPERPGVMRIGDNGTSLLGEAWNFPIASVGSLLAQINQPLGLGQIELDDGSFMHGFLCEYLPASTAKDISKFGGWRAFIG